LKGVKIMYNRENFFINTIADFKEVDEKMVEAQTN
jgi:hypothetical protein